METTAQWTIPAGNCNEGAILVAVLKCINGVLTPVLIDAGELGSLRLAIPADKCQCKDGEAKFALIQLAKMHGWSPDTLKSLLAAV